MKETLEKYAEKRFPSKQEMYDVFMEGAKWQEKQKYSTEEIEYVLSAFKNYLGFGEEVDEIEWFKQYKK